MRETSAQPIIHIHEQSQFRCVHRTMSGRGHGNPLQCSCLENPHRQRSLVGYSPRGRKESDTTGQLTTYSAAILYVLFHTSFFHLSGSHVNTSAHGDLPPSSTTVCY